MKKLFTLCFASGICLLLAFSAVLAASASDSNRMQRDFLDRIEAGQTDVLLGSMHPTLRDQIDRPVFAELVRAINDRLGNALEIKPTGIRIQKDVSGTRITSEATIRHEHGEVEAKFVTLDGQLIAFDFASPKLVGWFNVPGETEEYKKRGERFIRLWLGSETDAAWEMAHPELQKVVSRARLESMSEQVVGKFGAARSVRVAKTRIGNASRTPTLFVEYEVETEQATLRGEIEFQFEGLKGHLLGFKI